MNSKLQEIFYDISLFEQGIDAPNETGSFYTNYRVAYHIVSQVLKGKSNQELKKAYYFEPANGGGIFTFSFILFLEERGMKKSEIEDIMNNRYLYSEIQKNVADKFEEILLKHFGHNYNFSIKRHIGSTLDLELLDVKEFFGNSFEGFNFIFGNPPYGFNDKEAKKKMGKAHKNLPNDIYGLFYIHCHKLLVNGGIMGLITPRLFML